MITLGNPCESLETVRASQPERTSERLRHDPDRRADYPFTRLAELSADRPLRTTELLEVNDHCGHATVLKEYAGLPTDYPLKVSIEGELLFGDAVSERELRCELPAILVPSGLRYPVLRERTWKALFAIGPLICYAEPALSAEQADEERRRLGRTLLAMPRNSKEPEQAERYCRHLEEVSRDFDSVRVCLSWEEVLAGRSEIYGAAGFECVTPGHPFDSSYLARLRSIIELSTVTTADRCGNQVGYCAALGKPHVLAATEDTDAAARECPEFCQIERAFAVWTDELLPTQRQIVNVCWGLHEKKSPAELRLIFRIVEDMYRRRSTTLRYHESAMEGQADIFARLGKADLADYLEEQIKAIRGTKPV